MMNAADIFYSFPRVIDLSLVRMQKAIALLPIKLPPVIHIAGTNGKGSTLAFLRSILEAAGLSCHVFTSPHLITIHERFVIAGQQISEAMLLQYAQKVKAISQEIGLTIFEAQTLAGFLAFSENKADYLLLETGLGGRLDATNAIDEKLLTIIAPIDYDHKEFLGEDLGNIAREKCGILRKDTPAIIARQRPEIIDIITQECENIGAPFYAFGQEWDAYQSYGNLCVQTHNQMLDLPPPSLQGAHQFENAGTAVRAAMLLGIDEKSIANGVKNAKWPARMQPINNGKFGKLANDNSCELWLDGGHNPHGAQAAAAFIAQKQKINPRELILICGQISKKDLNGFFDAFAPLNPECYCVPIHTLTDGGTTGDEAQNLANIAQKFNLKANAFDNISDAVKLALKEKNRRVIICGSLYLAGEFLALNI